MHPPYWDIIQFSKNEKDLSNSPSLEHFLKTFGKIIDNRTYFRTSRENAREPI